MSPANLRAGTNVLAIQGLNVAIDDNDFLLSAEMVAIQDGVADPTLPFQYLVQATPGAANSNGSAGVHEADGVLINEISARNGTLLDEDGDDSDWIELYNPHPYAVDLDDAYLSDDADNLDRWRFPSGSVIPPRGYLLVFASNKDRNAGQLHTNFRLGAERGSLFLVAPDRRSIVAEIRDYPLQYSDVSYGLVNHVAATALVNDQSTANLLIPRSAGDIPGGWHSADFDDSSWTLLPHGTTGPLPVGFGLGALPPPGPDPLDVNPNLSFSDELVLIETGHRLAYEAAPSGGTPATAELTNLAWAANGATSFASSTLSPSSLGANRLNDGAYGQGGVGGGANPWVASSSDANGFAGIRFASPQTVNMLALGTRLAGRGDGHFTLQYTTDAFSGIDLNSRGQIEGLSWSPFGSINSTEPDEWERQLVGFEELDNVTGLRVTFDEAGTSIAEIEAYHAPVSAGVGTDVAPLMLGMNSTALMRLPFTVDDLGAVDQLTLDMQYDDGFIAYINGIEVARDGFVGDPQFDSVAAVAHSSNAIVSFDATTAVPHLREGTRANVLAIIGLNVASTDSDFLILPSLSAQSVAPQPNVARHFLLATPGSTNGSAVDDQGPVVQSLSHSPQTPTPGQDLVVTADVKSTGIPIAQVNLHYRVMFQTEQVVAMNDDGTGGDALAGDGLYTGIITADQLVANEMVRYYVSGLDVNSNSTRWPLQYDVDGQDQSAEYQGTVVADPSNNSQLPRLQWFVQSPVPVTDGITEWSSRAALYFDGEFYDNVFVRVRGATSRLEEKKPFKFDFPEEHYFRYTDDAPRVEEFNLNATFQDKAYLREPLSYEVIRLSGTPAPDSQSVRVELNGEFFSVASMTQQIDAAFLEKNGLDPDGALYKMFNGITSSTSGVEKKTRLDETNSDLARLVTGLSAGNPNRAAYVFDNIDLPAAINYMVSGILVQDFDRGAKNYYVYRDTNGTGEWTQIPWDEDLTLGNRFYSDEIAGDGSAGHGLRSHPFWGESEHNLFGTNMMIDAIVDIPETREMYLRRLRTLMDEILQTAATPIEQRYFESRIDELAAALADDAAADLDKWGAIYGVVRDFHTAISLIKTNYLDQRREYLFETHNIRNLESGTGIVSTLIPEFVNGAQYFVPVDDTLGTTWTGVSPPANVAEWSTGQTGIGYEIVPADYATLLNSHVNPADVCDQCTTVMIRIPFQIPDQNTLDSIQANGLTLRMKYDDGFAAYINGTEVARRGVDGTITFASTAANHNDSEAVVFEEINISQFISALVVGQNVLAIHGVNQALTSSDFLVLPELVEGTIIPQSGDIAGIPDAQPQDAVILFDPTDYDANPASGNQDEEYLKLDNPHDTAIDISGWQIDGGVTFTFDPGTVIPAGGSLYVSPDVVAFRARLEGPRAGQR
ncbi:MAG: CotH kinase family protein, partial [Planctomycetales bacterium]|nr:CotH kinase family protein [Planctomycetales bacterium]